MSVVLLTGFGNMKLEFSCLILMVEIGKKFTISQLLTKQHQHENRIDITVTSLDIAIVLFYESRTAYSACKDTHLEHFHNFETEQVLQK